MNVAIRTDATVGIGTGHLQRCLTLADGLREINCSPIFFTRTSDENLLNLIHKRGHQVKLISPIEEKDEYEVDFSAWSNKYQSTDIKEFIDLVGKDSFDWIIVDHYGLNKEWETLASKYCKNLLIIDDLANRKHQCQILVDQNLGRHPSDYEDLIDQETVSLCGPNFAILRPEFSSYREASIESKKEYKLKSLLLFMGGTDKDNITSQVLSSLKKADLSYLDNLYIFVGSSCPWVNDIQKLISDFKINCELHIDSKEICHYMSISDLSIGASGSTSWERCCLGLPSIVINIAENQVEGSEALLRHEAVKRIDSKEIASGKLLDVLDEFRLGKILKDMSKNASKICDGLGMQRILNCMSRFDYNLLQVREARKQDLRLLFRWANDSQTRSNAFSSQKILIDDHTVWFENKLRDENCYIYIISLPDTYPLGQVRFDKDNEFWNIDYSIEKLHRGKGLGSSLLSAALECFAKNHPGQQVKGEVKKDNYSSIKVFHKCSFQLIEEQSGHFVTFTKKI